ncbi:MAG: class I SAM-dependent methyltransferase [Tissierellia bacterium]|nr:class I SAM-dependent methyltransferase [Tissierellia bacterium]
MSFLRKNAVDLSHELIERRVDKTSLVCDLTLGNGHDTLFLAQRAKKVYGFDIQERALKKTWDRLKAAGLEDKAELFLVSHEAILEKIKDPLDFAIMNLGYLPGGDKTLITKPESTLRALEGLSQLLRIGGQGVLVLYRGHPGARKEEEAVKAFFASLDQDHFICQKISFVNQKNQAPEVFVFEKRC